MSFFCQKRTELNSHTKGRVGLLGHAVLFRKHGRLPQYVDITKIAHLKFRWVAARRYLMSGVFASECKSSLLLFHPLLWAFLLFYFFNFFRHSFQKPASWRDVFKSMIPFLTWCKAQDFHFCVILGKIWYSEGKTKWDILYIYLYLWEQTKGRKMEKTNEKRVCKLCLRLCKQKRRREKPQTRLERKHDKKERNDRSKI